MAGVDNPAGFWEATGNSLVMIIATELGDKTFFLAAILSMRHSRTVVFIGAISALAIMHVLSVAIGFALPSLLPRVYTHYAAVAMFAYFGVRLLWEARTAESDTVDGLKEAEEELSGDAATPAPATDEESGGKRVAEPLRATSGASSKPSASTVASMSAFAVFITTFTLTFVAEWGDRSQIATIALGAAKNPFGVMLGGVVGHALCTGLAVVGGKFLATKISERVVLLSGGALFVAFALHSLWVGP